MKFRKAQQGSMVLEASLIFPFFLFFLLFLINMIKLTAVEITIHRAVCETTKQVATHLYPINLVTEFVQSKAETLGKGAPLENIVQLGEKILPQSVMETLSGAGADDTIKSWSKTILKEYLDTNLVAPDNLTVKKVITPGSNESAYFGIETDYKMKLLVPFFSREILLKHKAVERAWIGAKGAKK